MYNVFYDVMSFVMLFVRYGASSFLCLSYTRYFLKEKNGKNVTLIVWSVMYVLGAAVIYFAFDAVNVFQNIICTAAKIAFLLILQRLLFHKGGAINLFIVFSFLAGRDLTVSIIAVLTYQLMGDMSMGILNSLAESADSGYEAFLIEHGQTLLFTLDIIITIAAVAGYTAILGFYLKIIKKASRKRNIGFSAGKAFFLCFLLWLPFV